MINTIYETRDFELQDKEGEGDCDFINRFLDSPYLPEPGVIKISFDINNIDGYILNLKVSLGDIGSKKSLKFKERLKDFIEKEINTIIDGY